MSFAYIALKPSPTDFRIPLISWLGVAMDRPFGIQDRDITVQVGADPVT